MRNDYSQAIPPEWHDVSDIFIALGDEHRQRMLLLFEPGERLNVSQIAAASTLGRPTVSHHLKCLRQAGVLGSEKIGKEVFYWIDKPHLSSALRRVLDFIEQNS